MNKERLIALWVKCKEHGFLTSIWIMGTHIEEMEKLKEFEVEDYNDDPECATLDIQLSLGEGSVSLIDREYKLSKSIDYLNAEFDQLVKFLKSYKEQIM